MQEQADLGGEMLCSQVRGGRAEDHKSWWGAVCLGTPRGNSRVSFLVSSSSLSVPSPQNSAGTVPARLVGTQSHLSHLSNE